MKNTKLIAGIVVGVVFLVALGIFIYAYASQSGGLPAGAGNPSTVLYLCYLNDKNKTKILTPDECKWSAQDIIHSPTDYAYTLPGDIQGKTFNFNIWFESVGETATYNIQIILRQAGVETVLATSKFDATKNGYQQFVIPTSGIDPTTARGDILIFRVGPASGTDGAILYTSDKTKTSYIEIAPIK
jgi:hypothetical protein